MYLYRLVLFSQIYSFDGAASLLPVEIDKCMEAVEQRQWSVVMFSTR